MGSLKLQSFEDFATASKAAAELKIQEEQKAARTESAYQFETLLSEFGVTSVKDLNEEDRNKFFAKLGASEVSESLAIIEEGTRSQVGIISKRGKIESVYMHYDGYPDHMLPTIKKGYMNSGTVKFLLKKGGGSGLEADPSKINFYGDKTTLKGDAKKIDDYISDASDRAGAEFVYLFDERDGKWYMADVYGDKELIPAFESLIINEAFKPSKGNARDAKKVSKFLNTFFMKHSAIANSDSFLGACRYLLAEALTDANFHRYRDPVSKALGGKIVTIMVDIDNLGGMAIPVGKKTIVNLLDEHYSGLANAAGWSGIGIVEGMALFLDGFGYSQPAQKIVDAFELIWANESVMNEGNAFLHVRAKAIEEDAEEFEFNGKTYPVIKEDVDAICEATVEMDALDPDNKDFLKFLKKNNVKIIDKVMDGPGGGTPVITMQGKRKDLEKVLADSEFGWDDPELAEYIEETKELNEGLHPKLKKAMKAVNKGETVYGENIRFPGRFKIIEIGDLFATVDYEDGTEPMKMASMNIRIDSLQFESAVTEAKSFSKNEIKDAAEVVADAVAKVERTKAHVIEFETLNKDGKIAGFYIQKDTNKKGAPSRYWITDSGEVVSAFRHDTFGNGVISQVGDKLASVVKTIKANESVVTEAEVKSDEEFKEYAFTVLGKAFGDKFDEEKAQEVVDGLLSKHGGDYGAAVGALTASLG